ncbi:MAG: Ig-like domain-containing protein, partial [Halobacteriota archaeon]
LTVSNKNPYVGEQVTFTVQLKRWNPATNSYVGLPYKWVTVWYQVSGVWKTAVAKTSAYGTITWSQSWAASGSTTFVAAFAGDGTYAKSQSAAVTISAQKIPTKLTLDPIYGIWGNLYRQGYVSGKLTDQNGNAINKKVTIVITSQKQYMSPSNPGIWIELGTVTLGTVQTDSSGSFKDFYVQIRAHEMSDNPLIENEVNWYNFQAHFAGDSQSYPSDSNIVNPNPSDWW